jgi:exonuclease SbcC
VKIHSVRLSGFGAFKHETHVDFDEFAADGVFLISGPTGAGKSTLLDAIVFALYGSAPRYASQPGAHVRSHYSEPHDATWAEVEFTAGGTRYRVRRSPDYLRPKRRGEGFTTEKATAQLDALEDSHWVGLEAHPRTVAERLAQIIPLNAGQFLQVVLLAQGRFEQFLLASSAERQRLLRTLFDTGRFDSYDQALQARAAQARDKVSLAERAAAAEAENLAELVGTEVPADPNDEWVTTLLAEQLRLHEVAATSPSRSSARRQHVPLTKPRVTWPTGNSGVVTLRARRLSSLPRGLPWRGPGPHWRPAGGRNWSCPTTRGSGTQWLTSTKRRRA